MNTAHGQSSDTGALYSMESHYVPATNGTKLAVDVYFPRGQKDKELPALFELTRYWRSVVDPKTGEPKPSLRNRDSLFLKHDYILVKVDARGTGASFGVRPGEYTPLEVMDAKYILDWVVSKPWSNGKVGAYGTSYSGTTAELLCATEHPAVKAVIPGWSDFDIYESPGRPYGMVATSFVAEWSKIVKWLDNNDTDAFNLSVRGVPGIPLKDAVAEHKDNPDVLDKAKKAPFKDSKFGQYTHEQCSPIYWHKEISQSMVPMLVLAGWMDAGTADGALLRLNNFSNPQKVVLMPTSHGGKSHSSPFLVSDKAIDPKPTVDEQLQLQLDFFDHYIKGKNKGVEDWPTVQYYNFGEEAFRSSEVWPPEGQQRMKYYLGPANQLIREKPVESSGSDRYRVNYSATTGSNNRWTTQMGRDILHLNDRRAADSLALTYTTVPMENDLQVTGTPWITLQMSSDQEEGAVFVYLEDVGPDGTSRYITEGGLLLKHRKLSDNPWSESVPYHSFRQSDAAPMPVNQIQEVTFKLWPISVLIRKGHSLRIAIGGTDKDTFDRVPEKGTPVYTIYRDKQQASFLSLPVMEANKKQ
jgi:putative CocE/NonD family hydrolase